MDFAEGLEQLSANAAKYDGSIATEEATKTAMVMPFIQLLGYNVFDPREVVPEFTADAGSKRGEKVDYAIMHEGIPVMLVECKCCGEDLNADREGQLLRYFNMSDARIGVLTDGVTYKFYTDLENPNKMDLKPYMVFDVREPDESLIPELKKLRKGQFDIDQAISAAEELKYSRELKRLFEAEYLEPSYDFTYFFAKCIYEGRLTQPMMEFFKPIVKKAFHDFVRSELMRSFQTAVESKAAEEPKEEEPPATPANGIVTTEEEIEGFHIIRAIASEIIDPARIAIRDTKGYCGILLDNNNRKPVCRLYFNAAQKYVGLFDADKVETREAIDGVGGLYSTRDRIKNTIQMYDS